MNHRHERGLNPIVHCGFCEKEESPLQMKTSLTQNSDQYPIFYCCECCSFMNAYENGLVDVTYQSAKESHEFYMDTLKKCYPNIYKKKYGDK